MIKKKKPSTSDRNTISRPSGQNNSPDFVRDFMDSALDFIYFKDTQGNILFVNQAYAKALGKKPEDIIGKTDYDILPKKLAALLEKDDNYVLKTKKMIVDKIERAPSKNNIEEYISITKIPHYDASGNLIGLIGINRDITKRMQFEVLRSDKKDDFHEKLKVLEDFDRFKSDFISTISHELRTPLATVKQLLSLLVPGSLGAVDEQNVIIFKKMRNNLDRLQNIIDKLLDVSKIENKKLKLEYSFVNLIDLIRDSQEYYLIQAAQKNIDLNYDLPDHPVYLLVDADKIVQTIFNLLNNALKFTPEDGRIDLEVKVLESKVRVGVIDTGMGIAKEDLQRIFDKFVQISPDAQHQNNSLGLGLTFIKEYIKRHDGEIWVESELGKGSRFYFTLPRYYTIDILSKTLQKNIKTNLLKGKSVSLINFVVINYENIKSATGVTQDSLFYFIRQTINDTFNTMFLPANKKYTLLVSRMVNGKCNIITTGLSDSEIVNFSDIVKQKIKIYFNQNKIDNVYVAMGIMSFSAVEFKKNKNLSLDIKEVYIGLEMRRFRRVSYNVQCEVFYADKKLLSTQVIDISQFGLCISCFDELKTNEKIKIVFKLIKENQVIDADARVAWIKKMDRVENQPKQEFRIGLEYINISAKDKINITKELDHYHE